MKRFIIALIILLLITGTVILNRIFINGLYAELDRRLTAIESDLTFIDASKITDLEGYWSGAVCRLSLSVKECDIRTFSSLVSKMKKCKGEEYLAALAEIRLLTEELRKTESFAFFDLF
ncbi:MAG: hypothetical protein IJS94_08660 [Clostridia bacterium]|nr:hypothetical protein [Clostridia bacterium]